MLNRMNVLLKQTTLPLLLRLMMLLALTALVILGLSAFSGDQRFLSQLRNFNLGNLIVWCYWWPLIVITSITVGRVWCLVCPVELLTSFFAKIGLKNRRPKWL